MFSPICQWPISTQILGSREKKRFYQALRWMVGQKQCWLAWGSGNMSCNAGAAPSATLMSLLFLPAFYWLKFLFAYNAVLCSRWDITSPDNIWLSPKERATCQGNLAMCSWNALQNLPHWYSACLTRDLWLYPCFLTVWVDPGEARKRWGCPLQAALASLPP